MVILYLTMFGLIGFKALHLAYTVKETAPTSKLIMTQRMRYTYVSIGVALPFFGAICVSLMDEWQQSDWLASGPIGWIVVVAHYAMLVSPCAGLLVCRKICDEPARVCRRVSRGRYLSWDGQVVVPVIQEGAFSGRLQRIFVPAA